MSKLPSSAKKVISVVVAIGMIISLFSCMSGLSAFAIDNTPKATAKAVVATEKGETKTTAPAANGDGTHTHCICGAQEGIDGTGVPIYGGHKSHAYTQLFAPLSQADIDAGSATNKSGGTTGFSKGGLPTGDAWYLTEDVTVTVNTNSSSALIFCLNGHTITYNVDSKSSLYKFGGATADKSVSFCDCGGADGKAEGGIKVKGTLSQPNGGIFQVAQGGTYKYTLRVFGGKYDISESTMSSSGGILYVGGVKDTADIENVCELYDVEFIGSAGASGLYGGLINVRNKSKVTTYGGKYHDGYVPQEGDSYGGLVCAMGSSIFRSWGGEFYASDDTATNPTAGNATCGGLIAARDTSTVELLSGKFTGGTAKYGGILYGADGTTLKVDGANCVLDGGLATVQGGSIHVSAKCNLTVSGKATVKNGCVTVTGGNANGGCISNAGTTVIDGAKIDATGTKLTTDKNSMGSAIYSSGASLTIKDAEIIGSATNYTTWGTVYSKKTLNITGNSKIHGGNCYRGGTIYQDGVGDITIDLGDEGVIDNITSGKVMSGGCIQIGNYTGATLTIKGTGKITAPKMQGSGTGGAIHTGTGTLTTIEGCTITGNTQASGCSMGGAIYALGTVKMTGGKVTGGLTTGDNGAGNIYLLGDNNEISGNAVVENGTVAKWAKGGNIHVAADMTLDIKGDAVISGGCAGDGGNIFVDAGAALNISGNAQIKDGKNDPSRTSNCTGGNISSEGAVEITGGTISGGALTTDDMTKYNTFGGNIYVGDKTKNVSSLTISSGTVIGGNSKYGGNIFLSTSNASISGTAVIKDGSTYAAYSGGNIYVDGSKSLNISGSASIENGAARYGGNIYLATSATVLMSGGTVKDGHNFDTSNVESKGGNVFVGKNATFTLSGGTVKDGYSYGRGGNFCLEDYTAADDTKGTAEVPGGTLKQTGGTISGGKLYDWYNDGSTAKSKPSSSAFGGGNIYVGGTYELSAGELIGGQNLAVKATNNGGGGNISAGSATSKIIISGGKISGGVSSDGESGNISIWYLAPLNALTISGGTIEKGEVEAPEGFTVGGVRMFFSSNLDKRLALSGDAKIDDLLTITSGCHIQVTEFTGTVSALSANKSAVIGYGWDKDYVAEGQIAIATDEEGNARFAYGYNSGAPILVVTSIMEMAKSIGEGNELTLAELPAERLYAAASEEVKTYVKTANGIDATEESNMLTKAANYEDMLKVDVIVEDGFDGGNKTLFILHSGMDADAAKYDAARIVVTINGKTVGNDDASNITDAYKTITYGEVVYDVDTDKTDIEEYVYFTTVGLSNSKLTSDVQYTFYARICVDGVWISTLEANRNKGDLATLAGIPA